jgi:hypothetical protein
MLGQELRLVCSIVRNFVIYFSTLSSSLSSDLWGENGTPATDRERDLSYECKSECKRETDANEITGLSRFGRDRLPARYHEGREREKPVEA